MRLIAAMLAGTLAPTGLSLALLLLLWLTAMGQTVSGYGRGRGEVGRVEGAGRRGEEGRVVGRWGRGATSLEGRETGFSAGERERK